MLVIYFRHFIITDIYSCVDLKNKLKQIFRYKEGIGRFRLCLSLYKADIMKYKQNIESLSNSNDKVYFKDPFELSSKPSTNF